MKMKNKFSLRSIIVIIVLVIVVFMGGMYFGGRSTPAKEEITSTALTQKIRDINELAVSEYDYTKVGKFSNSLKFNGWTVPLTQKSFLITYEGKLKAGVDLSDVQIEKTDNKIIVKTSAVRSYLMKSMRILLRFMMKQRISLIRFLLQTTRLSQRNRRRK